MAHRLELSTLGEWIQFAAPLLPASVRRGDLAWAQVNASLPGPARVARTLGVSAPRVVVDARVADDVDPISREAAARQHIATALQLIACEAEHGRDGATLPPIPVAIDAIVRASEEHGWCATTGADRVRFDLPTRAGAFVAKVDAGRGCRIVVELGDLEAFTPVARRAAATLLLAVSGAVRLVTGAIADRDGVPVAILTAPLDEPVDRTLDDTLLALAAACQMCGREIQALANERVATDYLALWKQTEVELDTNESREATEEETCLQQL